MTNINIRVFKDCGADPEHREIAAGTTIEDLLYEYRSHLPYRVYSAKVNSDDVNLNHIIEKENDISFCDIRDDVAFHVFQSGLILILLKAVYDLYGNNAKVTIRNSINRGIFTTILLYEPCCEEVVSRNEKQNSYCGENKVEERRSNIRCRKSTSIPGTYIPNKNDLRQIEKRMWELVDANKPIKLTSDGKYKIGRFARRISGLMPPNTGRLFPFALEAMRGGILLRYPHPSDPNKLAFYRRDVRIFDAYEEEQEFLDSLKLARISDLNKKIKKGETSELIHLAEDRHSTRIKDIAQYILGSGKRVVLLAGPSSSGKTTTAKRLIEALSDNGIESPLYFGTDDYYVERVNAPKDKKGEYNYEGLDSIDIDLFENNIKDLLAGKTVDLPKYDFIKGVKVFGERKSRLKKDQIIIVEGIHALNKKLSAHIDDELKFKLYISPLTQLNIDDNNRIASTDVRLLRRIVRDNRTRGKSVTDTIAMWPKVRDGESVNIFPYNNEADVVFNSTLVYELPVLKKYAMPLLEKVSEKDAAYGTAKRLLDFLGVFTVIEDEKDIPGDSILREFIGGSRLGQ